MLTIWKFECPIENKVRFRGPFAGRFLKFKATNNVLYMWAEVDTEISHFTVEFLIVGTGHPAPVYDDKMSHVDTVFDGPLVWHIYEEI